jgi:hypothetical protein
MTAIARFNFSVNSNSRTIFLARAGNEEIRSLHDIKGKVVATNDPLAIYEFLIGVQYLERLGIYLHQDAKQVIHSSVPIADKETSCIRGKFRTHTDKQEREIRYYTRKVSRKNA